MNKVVIDSSFFLVLSAVLAGPAFASGDLITKPAVSAASITAGTVAGTPIAIVRKTGSQYKGCVNEFKKDSISYKFWGALYSGPVAAVAGPIKGTICGAKNAIRYSINKPFSKEAFSLGNLEAEVRPIAKTKINSNQRNVYTDKPENQPWGTPR